MSWDPESGELVVGNRRTTIPAAVVDNEQLLRTYLELVAEQRRVALTSDLVLRGDDIAVLAELLDLDDVALAGHLQRLLRLSERAAAALHRRLRRRKAAAAVGMSLLAAAPVGAVMSVAADSDDSPATTVPDPVGQVEVEIGVPLRIERDPATLPAPEDPVPMPVPSADAVVQPPPPPPSSTVDAPADTTTTTVGVEIGDAVTIER